MITDMLTETLLTLILAAVTWAMRYVPAALRIQIEARHREALHAALRTGVEAVLASVSARPEVAAAEAEIGRVVDYVQASVPDALKALAPSREHLETMARAKLSEALARATGVDPLAAALRDAGAPVGPR